MNSTPELRPPTATPTPLPRVEPLGCVRLKPWDRLQVALPPLSSYEFEELKNSINRHGVLQKVLSLPDGRIIDGVHRWKITNGKVDPEILPLDEDSAFALGIVLNVARRNLALTQIKEALKKRKQLALSLRKAGKTLPEVSKMLGVPVSTLSNWEEDISNSEIGNTYIPDLRVSIPKSEYEKIYKRVKTGEVQGQIAADYKVSQPRISQIIKRVDIKKHQKTPELPKGKYNIILADPPWEYEFEISSTRDIETKYPTMGLKEICALKIPAANDSILFLWTPMPKLREGLQVLDKWGFEYKTGLVWVKDKIGMGYYARSRHELVLIGTRGDIHPPEPERRPDSVINAPRREHSQKPDQIYELIEEMYPHGKYLELFARTCRENWIAWGNEVGD